MEAKFSTVVKDIIQSSREEAIAHGNDYISTSHILLGALDQNEVKENTVGIALKFLKVDLKKLRNKISSSLKKSNSTDLKGSIPLSKQAEKALKITYLEAKIYKSDVISSIYLLLSILRDEESETSQLLKDYKVDYDSIKELIEKKQITDGELIFNQTPRSVNHDIVKSSETIISDIKASPLSLFFDTSEYTTEEIKNIVLLLSELYANIGGDYLKLTGMSQFDRVLELV
ncbi:Clp protease N-terminal domain-containing protein [Mucilaginibacter sp.]|uniref:Clp protease N-terminal domain-containing protein n=1 Tax=Mucilaginibacter sp. TaxID=1882438 RepID=UPI0026337E13|nr:Clp protease N-terminal domain-containing protein [Mucilaginibacter sp.]MDB5029765.1 ATP-dependent Clp protease ATP-binding subunit ClpC [Mucilaginibacter sp.]